MNFLIMDCKWYIPHLQIQLDIDYKDFYEDLQKMYK